MVIIALVDSNRGGSKCILGEQEPRSESPQQSLTGTGLTKKRSLSRSGAHLLQEQIGSLASGLSSPAPRILR